MYDDNKLILQDVQKGRPARPQASRRAGGVPSGGTLRISIESRTKLADFINAC